MTIRTMHGYDFFEVSSAMQKAIRRADARVAGFFALELWHSGFRDYVWKRLVSGAWQVIAGQNGERYDRVIATRGEDYLLVYNYSGKPMSIDLAKISGAKKNVWWMNPANGELTYLGEFDSKVTEFSYDAAYLRGSDRVLIAVDSSKSYISKTDKQIPEKE